MTARNSPGTRLLIAALAALHLLSIAAAPIVDRHERPATHQAHVSSESRTACEIQGTELDCLLCRVASADRIGATASVSSLPQTPPTDSSGLVPADPSRGADGASSLRARAPPRLA